jgi:hypothetical protein
MAVECRSCCLVALTAALAVWASAAQPYAEYAVRWKSTEGGRVQAESERQILLVRAAWATSRRAIGDDSCSRHVRPHCSDTLDWEGEALQAAFEGPRSISRRSTWSASAMPAGPSPA